MLHWIQLGNGSPSSGKGGGSDFILVWAVLSTLILMNARKRGVPLMLEQFRTG